MYIGKLQLCDCIKTYKSTVYLVFRYRSCSLKYIYCNSSLFYIHVYRAKQEEKKKKEEEKRLKEEEKQKEEEEKVIL